MQFNFAWNFVDIVERTFFIKAQKLYRENSSGYIMSSTKYILSKNVWILFSEYENFFGSKNEHRNKMISQIWLILRFVTEYSNPILVSYIGTYGKLVMTKSLNVLQAYSFVKRTRKAEVSELID